MRAHEFLKEVNLNIPDQMVSIQVPLSSVAGNNKENNTAIINPGKRASTNGDYKWSPPLQAHLDVTRDAVGVSNDEINVDDAEAAAADQSSLDDTTDPIDDLKKALISILSQTPSALG